MKSEDLFSSYYGASDMTQAGDYRPWLVPKHVITWIPVKATVVLMHALKLAYQTNELAWAKNIKKRKKCTDHLKKFIELVTMHNYNFAYKTIFNS